MNKPVKNLSASVHQRLLNKSRETNQPFNELIQYYGIERLLYRLSLSQYSRQFVLKGALMFKAWGMANFRPTRDVDLLGHALNTLEHIKALFEDVCRLEVSPDGLEFDKNVSVGRIKEDSDLWVSTRDHHRGKIPGDDCPRHGKQPHERFFFGDGLTWDDVFNRQAWRDCNAKRENSSLVYHSLRFGYDVPQGGEANTT